MHCVHIEVVVHVLQFEINCEHNIHELFKAKP
jgi:hypothetical protein